MISCCLEYINDITSRQLLLPSFLQPDVCTLGEEQAGLMFSDYFFTFYRQRGSTCSEP